MHILARLDEATLRGILDELLPVTLLLDDGADGGRAGRDGRWVRIEPTHDLDFVAGTGLRLATGGQIRWLLAGVPLEATLHSIQIMLRPEIVPDKHGGKLVFRPSLESADLKNVPAWIDRGIVSVANRLIEARGDQLAWDFGRSLSFSTAVPATLEGIATMQLGVQNATVQVLADAIQLGLTLSLRFQHLPQT